MALPKARVDEELAKQNEIARSAGYKLRELKGVYFTVSEVEAAQLPKIARDPLVFLTDISYEWAKHEVLANKEVQAGKMRIINGSPMLESVFRYMEGLGLDNFSGSQVQKPKDAVPTATSKPSHPTPMTRPRAK